MYRLSLPYDTSSAPLMKTSAGDHRCSLAVTCFVCGEKYLSSMALYKYFSQKEIVVVKTPV
jgi:hypothetical protein